ncbi:MAG: carbohydrate-binding domain-containing protein [Muricoprocola sp.]
MVKNKRTNMFCLIITAIMLVVTSLFMQGEKYGLVAAVSDAVADEEGTFSERDLDDSWNPLQAVNIDLSDIEGLTVDGAYELNGDLYIISKGVYVLTGELAKEHQIIVDAKDCKPQIVLNGVTVENESTAPIYVKKADKVFLTLVSESENKLSVTDALPETENEEGDTLNAVIYSKSDLTINGDGALEIQAKECNGIRSSDDLVITAGSLKIDADENAVVGHDSLRICGGEFELTAGKDGLKSNNTDEEKGNIVIEDGTFKITAECDAIQAEADLTIRGGEFHLVTGGGSENAEQKIEAMGRGGMDGKMFSGDRTRGMGSGEMPEGTAMPENMPEGMEKPEDMPEGMEKPEGTPEGMEKPEGMPEGMEKPENMPEGMEPPENMSEGMEKPDEISQATEMEENTQETMQNTDSTTDSTSAKGLKAGKNLSIDGGTFVIDAKEDTIHSNDQVVIGGGTLTLTSGDDGIHGDGTVFIEGGEVNITQSYEGVEGAEVYVREGTLKVTSSDDGMNASTLLQLDGGDIYVNARGDGLDSNKDLVVNGGNIIIDGPSDSGNGALDCGTESGGDCTVHGGVIIALGSSGMAESFSDNSSQYSFTCILDGTYAQGDMLQILTQSGEVLFEYELQKSGNCIIFSSPELEENAVYTVKAGELSKEITLDSISAGDKSSGFGGFGGGRGGDGGGFKGGFESGEKEQENEAA